MRGEEKPVWRAKIQVFPFLFGGTFIEGRRVRITPLRHSRISLPFRRDFH